MFRVPPSICLNKNVNCINSNKCFCQIPTRDNIHSPSTSNKVKRVTFEGLDGCTAREARQVAQHDAEVMQLQHAREKEEKTRQLVIDAYINMSQQYLPPSVSEVWFGPGGVLSTSNVSPAPVPLAARVSPPPTPAPVDEATNQYRLPAPIPLSVPRAVRTVRSRAEPADPNYELACSVRAVACNRSDNSAASPVPKHKMSANKHPPQIKRLAFIGDGTLSESKVRDILRNSRMILDPDSQHSFPPTQVLNLCKAGQPPTFEDVLRNERLLHVWANFRPHVTILQLGTHFF